MKQFMVVNISEHRLNLKITQAYIIELERGYVPPESWDRGIDAFYISYNLSQYRSYDSNNNSNTASYGRFNSGLNYLVGNYTLMPAIASLMI